MGIFSSIINGLFGIGQTAMANDAARDQQAREFAQQNSLLQQQNAFSREMWDAANEYNDPANQMKRLVEAGINPDAAAQGVSGSPASGSSSQISSSSAPSVNSIASTLSENVANSVNTFWQNELMKRQVEYQDKVNDKYDALTDASISDIQSQIEKRVHENRLTDAEAKTANEMLPLLKGKTRAEITQIRENTNLLIEETKNAIKQRDLMDSQKDVLDADAELKKVQTGVANQQKDLTEQQAIREKWRNLFIKDFGADPDSPWINELIQSVMSGKGIDNLNQVFSQITDLISESFSGRNESFPNRPRWRPPQNAKEFIFGWNPWKQPGASGSW